MCFYCIFYGKIERFKILGTMKLEKKGYLNSLFF